MEKTTRSIDWLLPSHRWKIDFQQQAKWMILMKLDEIPHKSCLPRGRSDGVAEVQDGVVGYEKDEDGEQEED